MSLPTDAHPPPPIDRMLYRLLGPHLVHKSDGTRVICHRDHYPEAAHAMEQMGYQPKNPGKD